MASAPPVPPVTEIDLIPFSEIVDNARIDHEQALTTGLVATANEDQPDVASRDRRTLRFYGEARVIDDPALTRRIWDRVPQIEKATDKERQGVAVLVRVDRVRAGPLEIQRRP